MNRSRVVPYAGRVGVVVAAALLPAVVGAGPATASTFTQETESGSDPFSGSFECDGFDAVYSGVDHFTVTNWFDADGNPVRQEGRIRAVETDTNLSTGATVEVRTNLSVHVDFAKDVQRITGVRNFSNQPGRGVVIQSVGQLKTTADGETVLAVRGPADDIFNGGGFCEALAG